NEPTSEQPSQSAPQNGEPHPVVPVLDYRTADSPTEPSRKLIGTVCTFWALVMVLQSLIGIPWTWGHYFYMVEENDRQWSSNELERRMYEIDLKAHRPVGKRPAVHQSIVPYSWTPLALTPVLLAMCGWGFVVGRFGRNALARNGKFKPDARKHVRALFIIPC